MNQRSDAAAIDPRPGRLRLALAARAEADTLRAQRAERLARIRAGGAVEEIPDQEPEQPPYVAFPARGATSAPAARNAGTSARDMEAEPAFPARDVDALERFLADLVGTIDMDAAPPQPARVAPTRLAPVRALAQSTGPAGDGADLARLPGAGPGLVGALIRGGVPDLAALAGLGRESLGQRLGPLARLIDIDGWLDFARAASGRTAPVPENPSPRELAG